MKKKVCHNLSILVLLVAFFVVLGIEELEEAYYKFKDDEKFNDGSYINNEYVRT